MFTCEICCDKFAEKAAYVAHYEHHQEKLKSEPGTESKHDSTLKELLEGTSCAKDVKVLEDFKFKKEKILCGDSPPDDEEDTKASTKIDILFKGVETKPLLPQALEAKKNSMSALWRAFPDVEDHVTITRDGKFICNYCALKSGKKITTKLHILRKHRGAIFCRKCYEIFETSDDRVIHTLAMHPYQCLHCSRAFTEASLLLAHVQTEHGDSPFVCQTCNKSFGAEYLLRRHDQRMHAEVKRTWKCLECPKVYSNPTGLIVHRDTVHRKQEPVVCSECGKLCASKHAFKQHELNVHRKVEREYPCKVCHKIYRKSSCRKVCEDKHEGNPRFKCDLCSKAYYQRGSLIVHKRIHSGEKPYQCWMCDRRFYTDQILLKHALSHGITAEEFRLKGRGRGTKTE